MALDNKNRQVLGHIIGETTHSRIIFTAVRPPRVGEYVLVEYPESSNGSIVLGIVERSVIGNPALEASAITPSYVEKASRMRLERHEYMIGHARLLGWLKPLVEKKQLITPNYPPRPGAKVYEADPETLMKIFVRSPDEGWVRIGQLVNHRGVPVYINVSAVVSRHLAILAVTGAGKSNTVGVLVDRIVNDLGGTVLIIDMHNEYGEIAGPDKTNNIEPKIHPAKLAVYEYYNLLRLDAQATKQRLYLRKAYRELCKSGKASREPDKFLDHLEELLEEYNNQYRNDSKSITDLLNKLDELRERYEGRVLAVDAPMNLESVIVPGKANVIKLGSVDEEVADVVVYHYLDWLLKERKNHVMSGGEKGYPVPVLVVIEEAHILIPRNRPTLTKQIAARVAREGRKFGLGLCLVSQRPKNIDEDALSQTNNKIILKLVEPNDKRYVQHASETLSEELMEMLSDLNVGEAIILGMMTPIPALVKIDKAEKKVTGTDIQAHAEWRKHMERQAEKDLDFNPMDLAN